MLNRAITITECFFFKRCSKPEPDKTTEISLTDFIAGIESGRYTDDSLRSCTAIKNNPNMNQESWDDAYSRCCFSWRKECENSSNRSKKIGKI